MSTYNSDKFDKIPEYTDNRGTLVPVEHSGLPFEPQRTFVVCNVPKGMRRGYHAHFECRQMAYVVFGEIKFELFDGLATETFVLKRGEGVLIDKLIWDTQQFLSDGAVLLVMCSIPYTKSDYITDMELFKKLTKR